MDLKHTLPTFLFLLGAASAGFAQDRAYKCGSNTYTNDPAAAKDVNCKIIQTNNVSVIPGTAVKVTANSSPAASGTAAQKVDANDQRARDADARAILEDELRKAETRLADLRRDYNNGEPQRTALELNNPQAYSERTAELKAGVARAEADVAGIRRELGRLNK